ncbi:MAG: RNA polymerase sigma factor [Ignavibacteriaceae bacterium]
MQSDINKEIEKIYKSESGRILASLVRILGDFELAEEAKQEAFSIALEKWPKEGIPKNPYSWLISAGKFRAIDSVRKMKRGWEIVSEKFPHNDSYPEDQVMENDIVDDQLRLIFFCCHPALPLDSRIALSLRDVCGMTTGEIAHAYLVSFETIKKRITRAKLLFREKKIPFEIPPRSELKDRMEGILHVIYLIFNEGYSASSGEDHIRKELTDEAIYLCRNLVDLISIPESLGLLALLLLLESRRTSRITQYGDIIPLEKQDRTLWDQNLIREGLELITQAVMSGRLGSYTIQAAIASVHAVADSLQSTRWDIIVGYYDMLMSINPSPVIELNRAIAVGMHEGPETGLVIINELLKKGSLDSYHLIYSAKADFSQKLGLIEEAVISFKKAIKLARQEPERRYLENRLSEIIK